MTIPNLKKKYAKNAKIIVGPLLKPQVQSIASLQTSVPILALNYLNSDISNYDRNKLINLLQVMGVKTEKVEKGTFIFQVRNTERWGQ